MFYRVLCKCSCVGSKIIPQQQVLNELRIICSAGNSCQDMNIIIDELLVKRSIFCIEKFSCNGGRLEVNAVYDIGINVECDNSYSCYQLVIDLTNNEDYKMRLNVHSYTDYASNEMMITTQNAQSIFITFNMFRYSQNVNIYHHY